ncbi:MAG TPA: hypothetical protein VKB38_08510 [Terracidiphilus sp.]|nr:hypothetical protein [Terracidiphilus sp.]
MALEATFRGLSIQIRKLSDTLNAILLTVGDRPQNRGTILADQMENSILDLMGSLSGALTAARTAAKSVGAVRDMDRARRALAKCQEYFHGAEQQFANQLVSYESLSKLTSLGAERGGEWKHWAASMKDAIEQGRQPFEGVSQGLAACWHELAEHSGSTSISVRSQNVGQKIFARSTEEVGDAMG